MKSETTTIDELAGKTLTKVEANEHYIKLSFGEFILNITSTGRDGLQRRLRAGMGYNEGLSWLEWEVVPEK